MITKFFIASEVRSGSTYIAECFSYSLAESFGVECWSLAQEGFAQLAHMPYPELAWSVLNSLFINQAGFRCAKLLVKDLSGLCKATDTDPNLGMEFFGEQTAWLFVKRRNKVRQAVSLAFAEESGIFHHYEDGESAPDQCIELESSAIMPRYLAIVAAEDYLKTFETIVCRAKTVYYEDFLTDPLGEMRAAIEDLSLPFDASQLKLGRPQITPTAQMRKSVMEAAFTAYLLRNM